MKGNQVGTQRVLSGAGKTKKPAPRKIYPHAMRPRPTQAQNAAIERLDEGSGTPTDLEHICLLAKQCNAYGCPHVADTSTRGFTLETCPKYCQLKWEYEDTEKLRRTLAAKRRARGGTAEAVKPRPLSHEERNALRELDECRVTAERLFILENLIRACEVDGCVHKVSSPSEIHSGVCICPGYCDIRAKAMPLLLMAQ